MSEPTTLDREIAGKIYDYVMSPPGPCPLVEIEHIATILATEREKEREVLESCVSILKDHRQWLRNTRHEQAIEKLTTLLK